MNLVDMDSGVGSRRPDPPQQAEPVTMGMNECLKIFIADPTTFMVAKLLAAAYLFCCYAVMRVEQAQECWIDTFFDGYCSTVQGLLDWFEVNLGFTRAFIYSNRFVCSVCFCSPLVLFWTFCTASPARWECL